uniref:PDZ and LIM domain-containing protein n=1 Tax=Bos indicus x Bos taurus TaxID=30522 RepID=A0A4W2HMU9_BOBOX
MPTFKKGDNKGERLQITENQKKLVFGKESEVYKMLLEKHELNEPLRQPTSFLVLQETLKAEEKGDPNKPSGLRNVKAPVTKVATLTRNAQK